VWLLQSETGAQSKSLETKSAKSASLRAFDLAAFKHLLEGKVDLSLPDPVIVTADFSSHFCAQNGRTALHVAARRGNIEAVRVLLESKASVLAKTTVTIAVSSD